MKLQSSLEFLTTYSFMFVIIGVALLLIIVLSVNARTALPSSCSSSGGLNCEFVSYATNNIKRTSNVLFIMTNAQGVPVNVIRVIVSVDNQPISGICSTSFPAAPAGSTFTYPGNTIECGVSYPNLVKPIGTSVTGAYSVNAFFCDSSITQLNPTSCSFEQVTYTGSFSTQVVPG